MRSYSLHEGLLYPGAYVRGERNERQLAILRSSKKKPGVSTDIELKEFPGSYLVEIALPGTQRDEIALSVEDNLLIVDLLRDNEEERQFRLPENADMDFVCAEFRKGRLTVHIPKALVKGKTTKKEIVVY